MTCVQKAVPGTPVTGPEKFWRYAVGRDPAHASPPRFVEVAQHSTIDEDANLMRCEVPYSPRSFPSGKLRGAAQNDSRVKESRRATTPELGKGGVIRVALSRLAAPCSTILSASCK